MNNALKAALGVAGILVAAQAAAQVTFYDHEGLHGRTFNADRPIENFDRYGFNDRAASAEVFNGSWEVCADANFNGRCIVLQPGRYDDLGTVGLKFQISSVRPVEANTAMAPNGYVDERGAYDDRYRSDNGYRRRDNEDLYTADVSSVRAVMGPPGQQCWVDRDQVERHDNSGARVAGGVAGAVIGGILGHQIGGGSGRDVATAAGVVGGAVAGSHLAGRASGGEAYGTQDVQHRRDVPNDTPTYYDVTYFFRGHEHHVQMSQPPGPTIAVNAAGEPRM